MFCIFVMLLVYILAVLFASFRSASDNTGLKLWLQNTTAAAAAERKFLREKKSLLRSEKL